MREKWTLAIKGVVFVCLVVILTQVLGDVFAKSNEGYLYSDIIYMADQDDVDAVFIGSSHCYCTVIPQMIYDQTGIQSIVVADNMESTKSSYWAMREVTEKFPQAKIFIELYTVTAQYNDDMHHNFYTSAIRRMPQWNLYKYLGLNDMKDTDINWQYYFRFFTSRSRLFHLQYEDFPVSNRDILRECKGYDPRFDIIEDAVLEEISLTDEQKASIKLDDENLEYIQKIIDFSNEKGIDVTFFCSPYLTSVQEDYQYQLVDEYITQQGKEFINFNLLKEDLQIQDVIYYKDKGHTNYYGARVITGELSQYLVDMIPTESIQDRERDGLWEDYRGCYDKWEDFNRLSTIIDTEEYFEILQKYGSDVVVVMALQGDYAALYHNITAEKMTDFYSSIGLTESNTNRVFLYAPDTTMAGTEDLKINYNRIPVILRSQEKEAHILVNGEDISKQVDGINICVYNAQDMTLIDNVAIWNGTPDAIVR